MMQIASAVPHGKGIAAMEIPSSVTKQETLPEEVQGIYELEKVLGRGAFGVVWMGKRRADPFDNNDDEYVALKIIDMKNQKRKTYTQKEISVLSELRHPNIIRLIRVVPIDKGAALLVALQLVRGPNLQHLVGKQGALGIPLVRLISRQLVAAVSYLHGRAVVHRNINPSNCILVNTELRPEEDYDYTQDQAIWSDGADAQDGAARNKWRIVLADFAFARALKAEDIKKEARPMRSCITLENKETQPDLFSGSDESQPIESRNAAALLLESIQKKEPFVCFGDEENEWERESYASNLLGVDEKKGTGDWWTPRDTLPPKRARRGPRKKHDGPSVERTDAESTTTQRTESTTTQGTESTTTQGTELHPASTVTTDDNIRRVSIALETECAVDYGMITDGYAVGLTLRFILTGAPPNSTISQCKRNYTVKVVSEEAEKVGWSCFGSDDIADPTDVGLSFRVRDADAIPMWAVLFIAALTKPDPEDRMSVRGAQNHPWIRGEKTEARYEVIQGDHPSRYGDPVVPLKFLAPRISSRINHAMSAVVSSSPLEEEVASVAGRVIAAVYMLLTFFCYCWIARLDDEFESELSLAGPIMVFAISLIWGVSLLSDTSTRGERVLLAVVSFVISSVAVIAMFLTTHSCAHCAQLATSKAMHSSEATIFEPQLESKIWHILMSPDDEDDITVLACRKCVSCVVTVFVGGWQRSVAKRLGFVTREGKTDQIAGVEIEVPNKVLEVDDEDDLAEWYNHWAKETKAKDLRSFNGKITDILEIYGHLQGDDLADALKDYLCSPASRMDNPDPVQFLEDVKNPRFTGESGKNLTTATLQRIMSGEILKNLGVSVCFMLRFALATPEDHSLEKKPIDYTKMLPSLTEKEMKSMDVSDELPGLVLPQIDQDVDQDGSQILRFKKVMGVFTELPFEDKIFYFDTKAEYLAFCRFELENAIQDDWYFPRWLMHGEKGDALADLMAKKMKECPFHLVFEDPQSDLTISDRAFFGTGQKLLTPIKLPGVHEDHDFYFPYRSKNFLTDEHRDIFRYKKKAPSEDLLVMIKNFYPNAEKTNEDSLPEWQNKILQIDFAVLESAESRPGFFSPGSILYIDAASRMPIGIWVSSRTRMFLPHEGRDWEHAKYFFRVCERAALAGFHVAESHYGWSHTVSTAAWQTLSSDHGLRVLLKPYTLQAHSVNSAAYNMLVRDHSVLTHGAGFTSESVAMTFWLIQNQLNFSQSIPDELEAHNLDRIINTTELPLFGQGRRLYDVHRKFVNTFVSVLYPTDEALLQDDSVIRFWHHVNTYGRNFDPCVCAMDSGLFFDNNEGNWPANEEKRTCEDLLDHANFRPTKNIYTRRQEWCAELEPFDRIKDIRAFYETECSQRKGCSILYGIHWMRLDMGMQPLETRAQLVDFLATFIWQMTAGHQVNGDNLSSFVDPEHSGVRMREFDNKGELPLTTDVGTYVFGLSIAALTTIRSHPLMADWSPLYAYYASAQKHLRYAEKKVLKLKLNVIHETYKHELFDLSEAFFDESQSRRSNQRTNVFNPMVQVSSVAV